MLQTYLLTYSSSQGRRVRNVEQKSEVLTERVLLCLLVKLTLIP